MVTPRRLFALSLCLAFSAIGMIWFLKGTNWPELWGALRGGHYVYLVPVVLLTVSTYCLRAYRWQILLNPIQPVQWVHLLSAIVIGFMSTCLLPLRVGELVRPAVIRIKDKISLPTVLTTVVVERFIFDLLGIGFFVVVVLVMMPADGPTLTAVRSAIGDRRIWGVSVSDPRLWGAMMGAATGGMFILALLIKRFPSGVLSVGRSLLRRLPHALSDRGMRILMGLIAGLDSLKSTGQVFYLAALSIVHWGLVVLSYMALGRCFGLHFGFTDASLVFVVTVLVVAVPQGPGFVGVLDYAAMLSVQAIYPNVLRSTAQGYAIALHFVAVVPVILLGFAFLWWEGLSLRQVTAQKEA